MLDVLTGFAIIFVVIGVGFVLAHRGVIGKGEARLQFNRTAFWAATPALIFSSVAQSDTSAFVSPVVVVIAAASVTTMVLYWVYSRIFFSRSGAETMAGAAAASYYNSVNIGLPIATYVIGNATYAIPALVLQMAVLSPFIIAGLNVQGTNLRSIWRSVVSGVTAPVVLAAVAGFIVSAAGWQIPDVAMQPLEILGGASIPMILVSFGASLKGDALLQEDRLPTITATVLKLVGMPAIALVVGASLGLGGTELYAALILAALPTAQNVYNYAATYEVGETVARDTVFLTTFLSLPAMLAIAAIFG